MFVTQKPLLFRLAVFFLAGFLPLHDARAALRVAAIFTNHMVLPRDKPIPLWGQSLPDDTILVTFANQTKIATSDATGNWRLQLDELPACTDERTIAITSTKNSESIKISGVLVGDVWLCSGQSNMHFRMNKVANATTEIAAAHHPQIRFFTVAEQFSQQPETSIQGKWQITSPTTVGECSAVAYYFARDLQKAKNIPVGLLISSVGGTRIQTWMNPSTLKRLNEDTKNFDLWKNVSAKDFNDIAAAYRSFQYYRDKKNPSESPPKPPKMRCHDCPGALHFGMIAPLQPFPIRGVIWYQGEANSNQPENYRKLLPAMIADWRHVWGAEIPFLIVQLAPFSSTHPAFREAQASIVKNTPHTALAVTTDVGDAKDIHPTRKQPVGERLALAARALSYGDAIESSGPVFQSMSVNENRAILQFTHTANGILAKGGVLKGFVISGADGTFHPADAVIQEKTVIVRSPKVSRPLHVRFGWQQVPDVDFYNSEGLPAVPFRTDSSSTP